MKLNTKKLVLSIIFAALAVVGSFVFVPVFGAKAAPFNILLMFLLLFF